MTYDVQTVSTRRVPAAHRTELWSETVTTFQGTHAYGYPSPEYFHARATRQRSSRFQLVTWHIEQEQTISRTRAQIRAGVEEEYRLLFPLAGSADLRTERDDARLTPAAGVLFAPGEPFALRLPPGSRGLVATLPRSEFDDRSAAAGRHHRLSLERGPGRVLALMLTTLVHDRDHLTGLAFDTVCGQAAELARLLGEDRSAVPEHGLVDRIRLVVRHHASDPELTGADVARHVGWSLRQVQAVLHRAGTTPSALIREARLDRARSLLDSPDRTVTAVAGASGFHSIDALEKAFRRRFGLSPSDYRRNRA
ncbi:helix-turn-helix transcriptional regulator [Pseudonocardia endophytica]|uniref:AraC-like protein n=1 Tax=Pseudonocardia endophytica TaxID=401976 RepID=A0A4R1HP41_PSEEN|nr:AraC family transcriptional regulator [Pseudonocardia endophytica]TCK21489.1 AraC-like protein [Pseudonocardia endophytica]